MPAYPLQGYSIKTVANVSVETEVPSHSICWCWNSEAAKAQYPIRCYHDFIRLCFVAPFKCGNWGCGYSEKSLFRQRVASWDKGAHRAFGWYLKLLLFNWSFATLGLKPYLFYEIWSILNDWTWPALMFLYLVAGTSNDNSEFLEWMIMISIVDMVLMSYMNEFKFGDRRDMRSRMIDTLKFGTYKYVLKLVRFFAMLYNLFHYFPRAQSPLVIGDRVALPEFIDDSSVFLDGDDADENAIREIWQNELSGELLVFDSHHEDEGFHPEEGSAAARTALLLVNTSDSVHIADSGGWKVHRPRHFLLRDDTWLFRRWDAPEPCTQGARGCWEVYERKQDRAGGSGLYHDLERFCTSLKWARDIVGKGPGEEDGSGMREQCVVALGVSIEGVLTSFGQLLEMQRQGLRKTGAEDAETVLTALQVGEEVMDVIMKGESDKALEGRAKEQVKKMRKQAVSLQDRKVDPEGDAVAVLTVAAAVFVGVLFGSLWQDFTGEEGKSWVTKAGLPEWTSTWAWFVILAGAAMLIFFLVFFCPLWVSHKNTKTGRKVPLQIKNKEDLQSSRSQSLQSSTKED